MSIETVTLIGADGTLGPLVLSALVSAPFKVQIIKRQSSKSPDSNYPSGVSVNRIDDTFPTDSLAAAFKGQDAVVVTMKTSDTDFALALSRAAAEAGVKRFIPADFGSVDSSSAWAQELVPLFKRKQVVRDGLTDLVDEFPGFSWTSLVCGHFADWSPEFLHVDVKGKKMDMLDDGTAKFSLSSLSLIARATVAVLQRLEVTRDKMLYVQSFSTTQVQLREVLERLTGGEKWEVRRVEAKAYEKERKKAADGGDLEAVEDLVWLLGTLDADWTVKNNFAMKMLGLEEENVDEVVATLIKAGKE